jgi:tetratricopeptide (TPR) repeat protein
LAGYIPDPQELNASLLKARDVGVAADWVLHILLSIPLDESEQSKRVTQMLADLPASRQIDVLKVLQMRAGASLTAKSAGALLSGHPIFSGFKMKSDLDQASPESLSIRILTLEQLAFFNHLAGNPAQADACLRLAKSALTYWQAGLDLQAMSLVNEESPECLEGAVSKTVMETVPQSKRMAAELGTLLVKKLVNNGVIEKLEEVTDEPMALLGKAMKEKKEGEAAVAKELGCRAARGFLSMVNEQSRPFIGDFIYQWHPLQFIEGLAELGLSDEAEACTEAVLTIRPSDPVLLSKHTDLLLGKGKFQRAKGAARLAVSLVPASLALRRKLAEADEKAGDWSSAYQHRKDCLSFSNENKLQDQLAFAQTAIQAGVPDEAAALCREILASDPDQASANGWLGMALAKQGQREEAAGHLERATLLAPEETSWWLMLSDMHKQAGERREAYDALRTAVMAAPNSGGVYSALGELLLEDGQSSEALPYLKRANELQPDDEKIGLRLSKAYHLLGHLNEASFVLEKLRHRWNVEPELAFEYASVASDLGDSEGAIPALEVAVRSERVRPEWMMKYADILLDDHDQLSSGPVLEGTRYEQAETLLHKVLDIQPKDPQARLMMADAQRKRGNYENALSLYQTLAEEPATIEPDQLWKIQRGLGLTALELSMTEPALAALKDAALRQPGNLDLQHDLARAYMAAKLPHDAIRSAEIALEIAPHDLRNLGWYADAMAKLGRPAKAEDALRMAVDLSPENPDLRLRLAQVLLQNGNVDEVRQTLSGLASETSASPETMRQAAYVYMRMEDYPAALDCLEKAVARTEDADPELLFDLAQLYNRTGDTVEALDVIQKAASSTCKDPHIFLFQAELLAKQNRASAAQIALDKALHLVDSEPEVKRNQLEAEIYRQMASTQKSSGSLPNALLNAEKALERSPEDLTLRAQTAELALSLLQMERAQRLAKIPEELDLSDDEEQSGRLALILAETSLELGEMGEAVQAWEQAARVQRESSWLASVEARLEARSGETIRAAEMARKAIRIGEETSSRKDSLLWAGKAAIECGLWKEGLRLLHTFTTENPTDPRGVYEIGKSMALAAERQRDCRILDCTAHGPDGDLICGENHSQFKTYMEQAIQATSSADASRWLARGEVAFAPSAQAIKDFGRQALTGDDTAAIVRAFREIGNWPAAALAAQQHPDSPEVQFQLCLGYLAEDPEQGLAMVSNLIDQQARNPMLYALSARLAEKADQEITAGESLNAAVKLWPDEAAWQARAAEIAEKEGDLTAAVKGWKAAVQQSPNHADYNLALGRAYLARGDFQNAVDVLDRAARMVPDNPNAWLDLAYASKMAGNLGEAMEAAQHASDLDMTNVDGVLLCSDVAREMSDSEMAEEYARLAVKRDPHNPEAVLSLSKALTMKGMEKESLEEIERHLAELPASLPLLLERAQLVYRMNGAAAASSLLMKLAQNYPDDPVVLGLLAKVQSESDDRKGAERSAFRSLRLNPNQPDLSFMLAKLQHASGQLDQAVHLLSETIRMQPDHVDAYLELGQTYLDRREHATALEVYKQALRADPKDPRAYYQAALIYKDSKDYMAAESMLQQAAKLDPEDLQVRRQLISVMALNLIHKSQEANTAV